MVQNTICDSGTTRGFLRDEILLKDEIWDYENDKFEEDYED